MTIDTLPFGLTQEIIYKLGFQIALANTFDRNPQLLEKHLKLYRILGKKQEWDSFFEWLFDKDMFDMDQENLMLVPKSKPMESKRRTHLPRRLEKFVFSAVPA